MTTSSSRRTFLRSAGLMTGGVFFLRHAPAVLETPAAAWQGAAAAADPLAAARAQTGAQAITTTPLGERLVMLSGPGGNVVVLHGPDGKVVVDSFVEPAWPKLKAALEAIDGQPVKTLIDTHWHFDHTDNNPHFREAGAVVLAHEKTKTRMTQAHDLLGMHFPPSPAAALPTTTFAGWAHLRANGEDVEMTHLPPAHTDTDIFVHYRQANVLHMGDVFFNGIYPFIDAGTGGTINGMIDGAGRALEMTDEKTKIVPGHGPLGDRAALENYRTVITAVRDRVRELKRAGKTLEQVQAAKPSAEFDAAWGKGLMTPDAFVGVVYATL